MRAQTRIFGELEFWLVGSPELLRTSDGSLYEYFHVIPAEQRLNAHAAGPFCRFGLAAAPSASGVYAIATEGVLRYIGRCADLAARFSSRGYGLISARNVHDDGQSTNCKLNSKILASAKAGTPVQVWFHSTPDFVTIEEELIRALSPEWNGRRHGEGAQRSLRIAPVTARATQPKDVASQNVVSTNAPTKHDFDRELRKLLESATASGLTGITITAGHLHKIVGCYPGNDHRMPACCARMRAAMTGSDRITHAPPKGNGASLTVYYSLPRR